MAVLSELKIDILSNFGEVHIVFDEIIFKDAAGNPLSNTGIVLTTNSNFNSSGWELQKLLNGLYTSAGSVQGWASLASPTYPVWLKCVFPVGFDCASVTLVNRSDGDGSNTSPKDITIAAFDANYDNTYTLSATRPSDASGASTTHNLADAVYAPIVKRGIQAQFPRKDQVDGGAYRLTGVVTSNGIPASRRVRLFDQLSGRLMRETWSDSVTGVYVFENIRQGTFFVLAHDHTGAFDPEAKADLVAEAM